jgi:hypothetical protein
MKSQMDARSFIDYFRSAFFIGILCSAVHIGLIIHHTYFDASLKNTRTYRKSPSKNSITWYNFLDLNRWDYGNYRRIVLNGYRHNENPDKPSRTVQWYPGYPLIAKVIYKVTGWELKTIFSLLSALFTLSFWLVFWSPKMVSVFGKKVLTTASLMILCWPGAFYWFAGMTEPLVAFLLIVTLYLWIGGNFNAIVALLCYATSVKQVFIPVAIAVIILETIRSHPSPPAIIIKGLIALGGYIGFGLYCMYCFGDFFTSSNMCIEIYKKKISLLNLIDFPHYARNLGDLGGITAFFSMYFLLFVGLKLGRRCESVGSFFSYFKERQKEIPVELALWWISLAYTSFCVLGDAYGTKDFMSIFRFQTANILIFLLLAFQFRETPCWKIICLFMPLSWVSLYWQNQFTVMYWLRKWIA